MPDRTPPEETLDPADWDALRRQGTELWDELVDWMATLRERPTWRPVPEDVQDALRTGLPEAPEGLENALADLKKNVLAYPYGNAHPRFWGWVNGSGLPAGILGDLVATAMNPNVGDFDHAAVYVEEQVVGWLAELLGFERETDGILTSGGSMANLMGIATGLVAKAGFDVRKLGIGAAPKPMTVYGSLETHSSNVKAVELLGLGRDHLRRIPVDAQYRIELEALARTIQTDRENGFQPIAIVGNAGTVNTGATDDLDALADLAQRENLWLHVDGAFGSLAWLCPEERPQLRGLQRADSLAFDPHKWLFLSNDVGCLLVRDQEALTRAFSVTAPYLMHMEGGLASRNRSYKDRGIELTRRFRALKVWLALKEHGRERFEAMIRANIAQARHIAALIEASPTLELLAPVPLNVVCFRFRVPGLDFEATNALNKRLLVELQESGAAVPSHTVLGGAFALRVAITNHRTRMGDLDFLVREVESIGRRLAAAHGPQSPNPSETTPLSTTANDTPAQGAPAC